MPSRGRESGSSAVFRARVQPRWYEHAEGRSGGEWSAFLCSPPETTSEKESDMWWLRTIFGALFGMAVTGTPALGVMAVFGSGGGSAVIDCDDDSDDDCKSDHEFFGRHLIASYFSCDRAALCDHRGLRRAMRKAVKASGATLLGTSDHVFPPHGYTAVMLLSESHASIHTYPESNACFVDLFTCGRTCSAEKFEAALRGYLRPAGFDCRVLIRDRRIRDDQLTAT